jgi:hypothetical protein
MSLEMALFGHDAMSELSPLSGEERKLDFEAVSSAFRRSRFFENAVWAISYSLIAVASST